MMLNSFVSIFCERWITFSHFKLENFQFWKIFLWPEDRIFTNQSDRIAFLYMNDLALKLICCLKFEIKSKYLQYQFVNKFLFHLLLQNFKIVVVNLKHEVHRIIILLPRSKIKEKLTNIGQRSWNLSKLENHVDADKNENNCI